MKNKSINTIFLGLFLCIMILPISPLIGADFKIDDDIADLEYHNNSTVGNPGSGVHSEIDIKSVEIDGVSITVSYVSTPINDANYEYSFRIYWDGDDINGNWTRCTWSNSSNYVHTGIETSTGTDIVDQYIYDVITVDGFALIIPIYNTSLITSLLDPHIVKIDTQFTITSGEEFYTDELDYATGTAPFPGFTFWFVVQGLSSILIMGIILNKKKN